MYVTERATCRGCGKLLPRVDVLSLGDQEVVDFIKEGEFGRGKAPLRLVECECCNLVQLRHTVDSDTLFKKFWYRSSMNERMREALKDVVVQSSSRANLKAGDFVLDIGSNDGELLSNYPKDVTRVGFEPSEELVRDAAKRLEKVGGEWAVIPGYFNSIEAMMASGKREYRIITAIAMFYDLDDPKEFLQDVKSVLAADGVLVIQMNYLNLMIRNLTFDNIGHEHLCYYSLTSLKELLDKVGLGIFDVELNDVNGGSFRVYAAHKYAAEISEEPSVKELLMQECFQNSRGQLLESFSDRVQGTSGMLLRFLKGLKAGGKKVYAYGASTRGSTLLQTIFRYEVASDYIIAAAERDTNKYGRKMAGLDIPIVPEEVARKEADYMLVLPYHFWATIREREKNWMNAGGKFILPLPYPKVVGPWNAVFDLEAVLEALEVATGKGRS